MPVSIEKCLRTLRCPACHGALMASDPRQPGSITYLSCNCCDQQFPIMNEIPRMLSPALQQALLAGAKSSGTDASQVATALSFGYEWTRFPEMYAEWEQSFLNYMQPHEAEFFRGKRVLDAGCGNGRFAYSAAKYGANVWAIDLGPAVEVARQNTEAAGEVQVVQADLYHPPFAP